MLRKRQWRFIFQAVQVSCVSEVIEKFSNAKPHDPHVFKRELKIKYNAVVTVVGKFPNRRGAMTKLLKAEPTTLTWANYYAMSAADQAMWEERGDTSTEAMLLLLNSKNNNTKKDLHRSCSQENKSAYLPIAKVMTRYLLTQYPNKNIGHQRNGKKGDKNKK